MGKKSPKAIPNAVIQGLRMSAGLSQQEVADSLNALAASQGRPTLGVTANTVSRWERGVVTPLPFYRRLLAQLFGVVVDELGFAVRQLAGLPDPREINVVQDDPVVMDPRVSESQTAWRSTRRALNARRADLSRLACQLYDQRARISGTGLLTHPDWLPVSPIDLSAVALTYHPDADEPQVDGSEPQSSHVRPNATLTRQYQRYTQAIRDIDHPRLFENRTAWRLLGLENDPDTARLAFGPTTYFAAVDVYEATAHEMAYVYLAEDGSLTDKAPILRDLPFRRLIGDPFNFQRRPIMPSIDTLTIRQGKDGESFVLHRRDPKRVAVAGGMLQVIPSGVFQPSSVSLTAQDADFDLWRNIMREYSEELLGYPEYDGDGRPVQYDQEPFRSMEEARRAGQIRLHYLGVALDALTLVGEILTVAVFDGGIFDAMAGDFVDYNDEGSVLNTRMPFTEDGITDVLDTGRLAPAGAGCIHLAWQHRDAILSR